MRELNLLSLIPLPPHNSRPTKLQALQTSILPPSLKVATPKKAKFVTNKFTLSVFLKKEGRDHEALKDVIRRAVRANREALEKTSIGRGSSTTTMSDKMEGSMGVKHRARGRSNNQKMGSKESEPEIAYRDEELKSTLPKSLNDLSRN
jgi:hypothetical protein